MKLEKKKNELFTQIQCFAQIARNVGNKITKDQIAEVFPLLEAQARSLIVDNQSKELENEIAEACLFAIESLTRKAPKEIENYIKKILELSANLVTFDPNFNYPPDNDDEDM